MGGEGKYRYTDNLVSCSTIKNPYGDTGQVMSIINNADGSHEITHTGNNKFSTCVGESLINCAKYSSIKVNYTCTNLNSQRTIDMIIANTSKTAVLNSGWYGQGRMPSATNGVYNFDISTINDMGYLGFCLTVFSGGGTSLTATINKIELIP